MNNIVFICLPEFGNDNDFYYLDVSEETIITITYTIQDMADITKRQGSYSKTISFPGTETNNRAFKHAYNVQAFLGGFTPNKQIRCRVYNDGAQIFTGTMQLLSIQVMDDKPTYECAIYSEEVSFFKKINDVLLVNTLNVDGMNHTWARADFPGIFNNTWSDGYVYALVDNIGLWHCKELDSNGNGGTFAGLFAWLQAIMDRIIPLEAFKPCVYVKKMVDLIFAEHGFTYQSNFFNTEIFEKLIIPYAGDGVVFDDTDDTCFVGGNTDYYFDGEPVVDEFDILFDLDTTGDWTYYNSDCGKIDTLTGVYTACSSYSGLYDIVLFFSRVGGLNDGWSVTFELRDASDNLYSDINGVPCVYTYSNQYAQYQSLRITAKLNIVASGTLKVVAIRPPGSTGQEYIMGSIYNYWIKIDLARRLSFEGVNVQIDKSLPPSIRQVDLLSDLQKMFNLYFMTSPENPKVIIIEPFETFYTNNVVDWSQKIDRSRNINITCGDPDNRKRFIFQYANTNEAQAMQYKADENEQYGTRIWDTENFYGIGDEVITTKCGTLIPSQYRTNIVISRTWQLQGNGVIQEGKIGYRIAQYNYIEMDLGGLEWWVYPDADGTIDIDNANLQTYWPFAAHIDNPINPTEDIAFGMPKKLYWKLFDPSIPAWTQYTNNNLFNKYWLMYITEITSKEAMTIEAYFQINVTDIAKLDFRNPIYFNGIKWRLLEISEYEVGKNKLVKCKLRRILNLSAFIPELVDPLNSAAVVLSVENEPTPVFSSPVIGL